MTSPSSAPGPDRPLFPNARRVRREDPAADSFRQAASRLIEHLVLMYAVLVLCGIATFGQPEDLTGSASSNALNTYSNALFLGLFGLLTVINFRKTADFLPSSHVLIAFLALAAFSIMWSVDPALTIRRTAGDLPSRVADNFYWLGRYLERLEECARLQRAMITRLLRPSPTPREISERQLLTASLSAAGMMQAEDASVLGTGLLASAVLRAFRLHGPMRRLLGRKLRDPSAFVRAENADALRRSARRAWLMPALRWSVGFVWLASAVVSFGLFPRDRSLALLVQVGVPPAIALPALQAAASLDLVLGLMVLFAPRGRRGYGLQALLILAYTLVITLRLPEFWLHPFGPVLKNLPMLVALGLLAADDERWTT